MTFAEWEKDNWNIIVQNIDTHDWVRIRQDFEDCWHDGYKVGYGRDANQPSVQGGRAEATEYDLLHDIRKTVRRYKDILLKQLAA